MKTQRSQPATVMPAPPPRTHTHHHHHHHGLLLLHSLLLLSFLLSSTYAFQLPHQPAPPPASSSSSSSPPLTKAQPPPPSSSSSLLSFRQALQHPLALLATLFLPQLSIALPALAVFPGLEECQSIDSNPSVTTVTCERYGLDPTSGRPRRCLSAENCISTSSINNPSKYSSPWVYNTDDTNAAWLSLVKAVEKQEGVTIVEIDNGKHYLRAEAPSKVPPGSIDDLEFSMVPKEEDSLVFFRSASRKMAFLYPLQQPLRDGGAIKKRLDNVQKQLGWKTVEDYYQY